MAAPVMQFLASNSCHKNNEGLTCEDGQAIQVGLLDQLEQQEDDHGHQGGLQSLPPGGALLGVLQAGVQGWVANTCSGQHLGRLQGICVPIIILCCTRVVNSNCIQHALVHSLTPSPRHSHRQHKVGQPSPWTPACHPCCSSCDRVAHGHCCPPPPPGHPHPQAAPADARRPLRCPRSRCHPHPCRSPHEDFFN